MKRLCTLALCAIATGVAFGSVLMDETISSLSPIVEPDWKRVLMARVAEADRLGLFEEKRRERLAEITRRAERAPDSRLPAARECATRRITLLAAERMQELHASARAALANLRRTYVLIDAGDARQCRCARQILKAGDPARIIVMAGPLRDAPILTGVRLYADQNGVMKRRFDVRALPTVIQVKGVQAAVTELPVTDTGCAGAVPPIDSVSFEDNTP